MPAKPTTDAPAPPNVDALNGALEAAKPTPESPTVTVEVPTIEWSAASPQTPVNPLAKWTDNIIAITAYRTDNNGEIQVNGTDWVNPGKRYFEKIKNAMDSRGGSGKVHIRATVTRTNQGRYVLK